MSLITTTTPVTMRLFVADEVKSPIAGGSDITGVQPPKVATGQPCSTALATTLSEDELTQLAQELDVLKQQPRAQMV